MLEALQWAVNLIAVISVVPLMLWAIYEEIMTEPEVDLDNLEPDRSLVVSIAERPQDN